MITEALNPVSSRFDVMKMVSGHMHIPISEMEELDEIPFFDPYEDSSVSEDDDWNDDE